MVAGVVLGLHFADQTKRLSPTALARIRAAAARAVARSTTSSSSSTSAPASSTTTTTTVPPLTLPETTSAVHFSSKIVPISYGGLARDYYVEQPEPTPGRRLPIVVDLSGSYILAQHEATRSDFAQVAGPAILVYPQAYELYWDAGACCGIPAQDGIDDVGFVAAVVAQVRRTVPDASQGPVYLAGYSNGGKLAFRVACEDPSLVAAVAVYGAVESMDCPKFTPLPLLELAGTADPEVDIGPGGTPVVQYGFTEPTVTQEVDDYLTADGCTAATQSLTAGSLSLTRWPSCAGGRMVALGLYSGQTHDWPQRQGATPSGQQVMWDFFVSVGA